MPKPEVVLTTKVLRNLGDRVNRVACTNRHVCVRFQDKLRIAIVPLNALGIL
jgi:hypothetical protein